MTASKAVIATSDPVPEGAGSPLEYISASRLKSFLECRFKFYLERVLGMKSPATANLHIGRAVHAGLQAYNLAVWHGEELDAEGVSAAYREAYEAGEEEDPVTYDKKDRETCLETGERVLQAYVASDASKDSRRILGVETWLRSDSSRTALPIVGVIDLVRDGGQPIAVDFKTTAATPDQRSEAWMHLLQLAAYCLLLRDATGEDPKECELVYLVKLKSPKVITQRVSIDEQAIDRFRALVDVYVDGVTREEFYPSPGMHCRWCPWHSECQAFTGTNQAQRLAA
jgi:putative RecB family exonuclease